MQLTNWRTTAAILFSWALANVLLYCGLEWSEASKLPAKHRPSRQALTLFEASVSRIIGTGEEQQLVLPYRLMSPAKVQSGVRYPLVVFLHGAGQRGDDNERQLLGLPEQMADAEWRKRFPCFLLAPQCPTQSSWTSLDDELIDLIGDVMKRQPIDPERVYLTGLSMGGFGCWTLAAREPDRFAAVVPICGGGDPKSAKRLIDVPIWAVHGDADKAVPVQSSREMIAAIREVGGKPNYTELPGVGHDSWTQTYRDPNGVLKWMFEQQNRRVLRSADR